MSITTSSQLHVRLQLSKSGKKIDEAIVGIVRPAGLVKGGTAMPSTIVSGYCMVANQCSISDGQGGCDWCGDKMDEVTMKCSMMRCDHLHESYKSLDMPLFVLDHNS